MTRIIAGEFGGRRLAVPRGDRTRPTTDRLRESWMSIIGPAIPGARVLDLYAGSGALGLEALSRGAQGVTFVEQGPEALKLLRGNIAALGVRDRVRVVRAEALRFARKLAEGSFDLALADPPYAGDHAERLVDLFRQTPFARVLVVEHGAGRPVPGDETRRYGDSALTFCYAA